MQGDQNGIERKRFFLNKPSAVQEAVPLSSASRTPPPDLLPLSKPTSFFFLPPFIHLTFLWLCDRQFTGSRTTVRLTPPPPWTTATKMDCIDRASTRTRWARLIRRSYTITRSRSSTQPPTAATIDRWTALAASILNSSSSSSTSSTNSSSSSSSSSNSRPAHHSLIPIIRVGETKCNTWVTVPF